MNTKKEDIIWALVNLSFSIIFCVWAAFGGMSFLGALPNLAVGLWFGFKAIEKYSP